MTIQGLSDTVSDNRDKFVSIVSEKYLNLELHLGVRSFFTACGPNVDSWPEGGGLSTFKVFSYVWR